MPEQALERVDRLAYQIFVFRGRKVILDSDLARVYGVTTSRLNQQVRRNTAKFPDRFLLKLTRREFENLMLQNATSSSTYGGRRKLPLAFTEHGAIMAATVLNSPRAATMNRRFAPSIVIQITNHPAPKGQPLIASGVSRWNTSSQNPQPRRGGSYRGAPYASILGLPPRTHHLQHQESRSRTSSRMATASSLLPRWHFTRARRQTLGRGRDARPYSFACFDVAGHLRLRDRAASQIQFVGLDSRDLFRSQAIRVANGLRGFCSQLFACHSGQELYPRAGKASSEEIVSRRTCHLPQTPRIGIQRAIPLGLRPSAADCRPFGADLVLRRNQWLTPLAIDGSPVGADPEKHLAVQQIGRREAVHA